MRLGNYYGLIGDVLMKLVHSVFFTLVLIGTVSAEAIKIIGTVSRTLEIPTQSNRTPSRTVAKPILVHPKTINFLSIQFSNKAQQNFLARFSQVNSRILTPKSSPPSWSNLPSKVDLGMQNVPVLDQGNYGTCVTFANTAAIDALIGKGDYVSQLCHLALGNYLEKNSYTPSGWNGSFSYLTLSQMDNFGIISKEKEKQIGCGGLTQYPSWGATPSETLSVEDYHRLSEDLKNEAYQIAWSSILNPYEITDSINSNKLLYNAKKALAAGDRLTFGVVLPDSTTGLAGAVGTYHKTNDSWVLTPEIARDAYFYGDQVAHEMILIGYDDFAIAVDTQGRKYHGLFTLRNSWGKEVGDNGNFYMSYEYFKMLVIEIQRIRKLKEG